MPPIVSKWSSFSLLHSIVQYYILLLSGMLNIDDQYINPNINITEIIYLVGQLTRSAYAVRASYCVKMVEFQSCKMSQIWQIYLFRNIGRLG